MPFDWLKNWLFCCLRHNKADVKTYQSARRCISLFSLSLSLFLSLSLSLKSKYVLEFLLKKYDQLTQAVYERLSKSS